jgi:hypothetical protein
MRPAAAQLTVPMHKVLAERPLFFPEGHTRNTRNNRNLEVPDGLTLCAARMMPAVHCTTPSSRIRGSDAIRGSEPAARALLRRPPGRECRCIGVVHGVGGRTYRRMPRRDSRARIIRHVGLPFQTFTGSAIAAEPGRRRQPPTSRRRCGPLYAPCGLLLTHPDLTWVTRWPSLTGPTWRRRPHSGGRRLHPTWCTSASLRCTPSSPHLVYAGLTSVYAGLTLPSFGVRLVRSAPTVQTYRASGAPCRVVLRCCHQAAHGVSFGYCSVAATARFTTDHSAWPS